MSEWADKDMDKLFREGSESCPFDFDPEAWQQMNALLDRHERRRRLLWWWWIGAIGIALLTALFSFFFFVKRNPATSNLPNNNSLTATETGPQDSGATLNPAENNNPNLTAPIEKSQNPAETSAAQIQGTKESNKPHQGGFTKNNTPAKRPFVPETASGKTPNLASFTGPTPPTAPPTMDGITKESTSSTGADTPAAVSPTTASGNDATAPPPAILDSTDAKPLLALDKLPLLGVAYFLRPQTPVLPLVQSAGESENNIRPLHKPSLLFGLLAATELNSVGQGDYSKLNWKIGLQAEYRFAQRWAVRSGLHYIHLLYDAGRGEYIPPRGFWVDGVAASSTRAECQMLEIPLAVSHYFKGHRPNSNGFFVSAGVASYIILEEHYWYNYDTPPPNAIVYWATTKDETNWFNLGHISGGYNHCFSEKLSLQMGPYMQFPLTGVGHGEVKIYGLGFQAVLGFRAK